MNVIDKIWVAKKLFVEQFGKEPNSVYIDDNLYCELLFKLKEISNFKFSIEPTNSNEIFGMKIFVVNSKEEHIGVGI